MYIYHSFHLIFGIIPIAILSSCNVNTHATLRTHTKAWIPSNSGRLRVVLALKQDIRKLNAGMLESDLSSPRTSTRKFMITLEEGYTGT